MNDYVQYAELSEEEQARLEDEADRENDERRIERIAGERPRRTLPYGTNDTNRGAW